MKKGGHKQKKFNYFQNYAVDGYEKVKIIFVIINFWE